MAAGDLHIAVTVAVPNVGPATAGEVRPPATAGTIRPPATSGSVT